jgi:hypothetical protein
MRSPQWAESARNLVEIGGLELATILVLDETEVVPSPEGLGADNSGAGALGNSEGITTEEDA